MQRVLMYKSSNEETETYEAHSNLNNKYDLNDKHNTTNLSKNMIVQISFIKITYCIHV